MEDILNKPYFKWMRKLKEHLFMGVEEFQEIDKEFEKIEGAWDRPMEYDKDAGEYKDIASGKIIPMSELYRETNEKEYTSKRMIWAKHEDEFAKYEDQSAKYKDQFNNLFLYQLNISGATNKLYFRDKMIKEIEYDLKEFELADLEFRKTSSVHPFKSDIKTNETLRDYLQYLSALNECNLPIDDNGDLFPMDIINKVIEWNNRYHVFETLSKNNLYDFLNNIEMTDVRLKIRGKDRYLGLIRALVDRVNKPIKAGYVYFEKADNSPSLKTYDKKGAGEANEVKKEIDFN